MSWGTELWDQYEQLATHTQKGLEFCEKYGHFIKERCAIEIEYAAKLKKLVKNYQPKKKEEEDYQFTCTKGFLQMMKEIHDIAGQHEVIAENLGGTIVQDIHSLATELKQERKKCLQDGAKQQTMLNMSLQQLDKSKKQYEKSFRDADKAQDAYKKADADINLSRADVEKCKNLSITKQQYCEDCKNEYASQLQKTNQTQSDHYTTVMPQIFQQLQDMDERRITRVQDFIKSCSIVERNVNPIINTCIDGMIAAADSINATEDSKMVVDKYKSGFTHPTDIPFEDLSSMNFSENNTNSSTPSNTMRDRGTLKGTFSGGKSKKRGGLFGIFGSSKVDETKEDFSNLPPNQQKKKLNQKIDSIRQVIAKETAERDGMIKMKDVYVKNPALGDPATLDKQLEENGQKLDKLQQELNKYENYLRDAESKVHEAQAPSRNRHSISDESMSRSASDLSQQQQSSAPGTPVVGHHYSMPKDSPDSGVESNDKHASLAEQDSFDELEDEEPLPVIGTCTALYAFEAQNEGSIHMNEGEVFSVVEQDQGDGWTRVQRKDGLEGFVPTSYIQIQWY